MRQVYGADARSFQLLRVDLGRSKGTARSLGLVLKDRALYARYSSCRVAARRGTAQLETSITTSSGCGPEGVC